MADLDKLAIEDRVKASYRISPKDTDKTCQATCVENDDANAIPTYDVNSKNVKIYDPVIGPTEAGVEKSQVLSDGTRKLIIKTREKVDTILRIAFIANGTNAGPYWEIDSGAVFPLDGLNLIGKTLYFQGDKNNRTVEILELS